MMHGDQVSCRTVQTDYIQAKSISCNTAITCGSTSISTDSPLIVTSGLKSNYRYEAGETSDTKIELNYAVADTSKPQYRFKLSLENATVLRATYQQKPVGGS